MTKIGRSINSSEIKPIIFSQRWGSLSRPFSRLRGLEAWAPLWTRTATLRLTGLRLTGQEHISGVSASFAPTQFSFFRPSLPRPIVFAWLPPFSFERPALIPLRFGGAAVSAEADIADAAFFGGRPRLFGAVPRRFLPERSAPQVWRASLPKTLVHWPFVK